MAEASQSVLLIEDEREIRELMALHLLRNGYKVKECATSEEAFYEVKSGAHDLILLDWMLPGIEGVQFLEQIRRAGIRIPILMVTAKVEAQDIILGLEKGADDYLTKPFEPAILMARVKALLRRTSNVVGEASSSSSDEITIGNLKINQKTYQVLLDNEELHLTPSEYKLLLTMALSDGRVLTREQLIENIQGEGINVIGRTVDTHIFGLRKKLGTWSDRVETIRGVGYRVNVGP